MSCRVSSLYLIILKHTDCYWNHHSSSNNICVTSWLLCWDQSVVSQLLLGDGSHQHPAALSRNCNPTLQLAKITVGHGKVLTPHRGNLSLIFSWKVVWRSGVRTWEIEFWPIRKTNPMNSNKLKKINLIEINHTRRTRSWRNYWNEKCHMVSETNTWGGFRVVISFTTRLFHTRVEQPTKNNMNSKKIPATKGFQIWSSSLITAIYLAFSLDVSYSTFCFSLFHL